MSVNSFCEECLIHVLLNVFIKYVSNIVGLLWQYIISICKNKLKAIDMIYKVCHSINQMVVQWKIERRCPLTILLNVCLCSTVNKSLL